jgi:hypothetical protein
MTSNYTAAASAAADPSFQGRVRAALYAACARIGSGAFVDGTQKAYYTGMMHQIIANPDLYVTAFCWTLAGFGGLDDTCLDSDLDAAIDRLWPAVSGYLSSTA